MLNETQHARLTTILNRLGKVIGELDYTDKKFIKHLKYEFYQFDYNTVILNEEWIHLEELYNKFIGVEKL